MNLLTTVDERYLIHRAVSGDQEAFRELWKAHEGYVRRLFMYWLGSDREAEDLCQETFARAFCLLASFRQGSALRSWLYKIAHNEFLQHLRALRAQKRKAQNVPLEEYPETLEETGESSDRNSQTAWYFNSRRLAKDHEEAYLEVVKEVWNDVMQDFEPLEQDAISEFYRSDVEQTSPEVARMFGFSDETAFRSLIKKFRRHIYSRLKDRFMSLSSKS